MPDPVVITRPPAQAEALAQRVKAIGRQPLLFPLLEIEPLQDQSPLREALADIDRYAMVVFVSPNAIDAAFTARTEWPRHVALAVMGEGSRQALAEHGITESNATILRPLDRTRTDSQTLLQVLDLDALRGRNVLIVRGESGRELLADALHAAGILVTKIAAYCRVAPTLTEARRAQLRQLIDSDSDWIITSSEALRNLQAMAAQTEGDAGVVKLQQKNLFVPHVRIAETAQSLGYRQIIQTGSGDEALLAALQSHA